MRLRGALLAATILAAPVAGQAQPIDGLYVGAGAGVNFKQDQDFNGLTVNVGPFAPSTSGRDRFKLTYDTGWVGLASVGYGLGNGLRFEVEGNYRQNNVRTLHGTSFPTFAGGDAQTYGAMFNALYDFDIAPYTGIDWMMPYVGVGAGYAWTTLHNVKVSGANVPFFAKTNDTDGNFAYQAIVGTAFPIASVPGLALTAEYRFFGVIGDTSYKGASDFGLTPAAFLSGRTFGSAKLGDQYNHSILGGIRYAFNAAPPPPPPAPVAPAPAAARSFLVFFDWDRADLTDRARQIVAEAARTSTMVQYTRIQVNGYTDTSGSAEYNQRLSVRRAQNVAAELVKDGVPRQAISIQGFGETHLLVPTGPNVREPQNRRVEIIIQ